MHWSRQLERLLLIVGLLMLGIYVGARIHGIVLSRAELQRFEDQRSAVREEEASGGLVVKPPDFRLWSEKRVKDYQESLAAHFSPGTAVLRIPKIHLEVPVLEGTDDLSLNRGVGLIAGTSRPGGEGNIGIAGHRDGFFRGLKDVALGDAVEIETLEGTISYVIDRIVIVPPSDVSVLAPRSRPSVTLVTCYPFYFVGSAPQRYIVQASAAGAKPRNVSANQNGDSESGRIQQPKSTQ
ncbi:MAG TPA: class D sortase [Terriglobales bacterium]|nr:class D sortase [Terriglobales bacterium]